MEKRVLKQGALISSFGFLICVLSFYFGFPLEILALSFVFDFGLVVTAIGIVILLIGLNRTESSLPMDRKKLQKGFGIVGLSVIVLYSIRVLFYNNWFDTLVRKQGYIFAIEINFLYLIPLVIFIIGCNLIYNGKEVRSNFR